MRRRGGRGVGGGGGGGGGCVREGDARRVCATVRRACVAAALSLSQWQQRRGMAARERDVNDQLCDAACRGDVAAISLALVAGANVNIFEGTDGWTPLHWAAQSGRIGAIEALLAAGAHVDGADSSGWTALMWAATNGRAAVVAALLAAGADAHRVNNNGDTALHQACRWGHVDCARALVDAGARADVRNRDGQRPIDAVRAVLRCAVSVVAPLTGCACTTCAWCARGMPRTCPPSQP